MVVLFVQHLQVLIRRRSSRGEAMTSCLRRTLVFLPFNTRQIGLRPDNLHYLFPTIIVSLHCDWKPNLIARSALRCTDSAGQP